MVVEALMSAASAEVSIEMVHSGHVTSSLKSHDHRTLPEALLVDGSCQSNPDGWWLKGGRDLEHLHSVVLY